jgi:membrane protease subunit HflC
MFDKLIEFIIQILDQLLPWTVIQHYEGAVRLRLGLSKGELKPGFHWKVPFADSILTCIIKPTTLNLSEQSVTTKDWKGVVVSAVIKYEIANVEQLLLEVNDPIDALADMAKGIIRAGITSREWSECNGGELTTEIKKNVRDQAKKWGIKVIDVTLTDLGEIRSLRLFNSQIFQN